LQVQILLAAQIGHGKAANVFQIVQITTGGDGSAIGSLNGCAGLVVAGDVQDVVAFVAVSRELLAVGLDATGTGMHAGGQVVDLVTGVVVVELAGYVVPLGAEYAAQRVA